MYFDQYCREICGNWWNEGVDCSSRGLVGIVGTILVTVMLHRRELLSARHGEKEVSVSSVMHKAVGQTLHPMGVY